MHFSDDDRRLLLSIRGVGPTVIARLEQIGISDLVDLSRRDAETICIEASMIVGSTCWKNSPQARSAIAAAIYAASAHVDETVSHT
jgi:hypothetical protein